MYSCQHFLQGLGYQQWCLIHLIFTLLIELEVRMSGLDYCLDHFQSNSFKNYETYFKSNSNNYETSMNSIRQNCDKAASLLHVVLCSLLLCCLEFMVFVMLLLLVILVLFCLWRISSHFWPSNLHQNQLQVFVPLLFLSVFCLS